MKFNFFDPLWNRYFYQDKNNTFPFWRGFLLLLLVNFFIGCIVSTVFYTSVGRKIPSYVETFSSQIKDGYTSGLVVTVKDGVLSKNIEGIVRMYPLSDFFKSDTGSLVGVPQYGVVIDDTQTASLSALNTSDALVFFGRDGLIAKNNNEARIESYKGVGIDKEVSFSKDKLVFVIDVVKKYTENAPVIIFVIVLGAYTVFGPLYGVVISLFFGLVVMLLSKYISGRTYSYKDSYILSLYALPSALLMKQFLSFIPYISFITTVPFFTTILLVLFLGAMFSHGSSSKVVSTHGTL